MAKNPNSEFLIVLFCEEKEERAGQWMVLAGEWRQLFSYAIQCINLICFALNFHQDIP